MSAAIPLESAYLCLDCSCVGESAIRCPACASEALMGLATVLDRDVTQASELQPPQQGRQSLPALPELAG